MSNEVLIGVFTLAGAFLAGIIGLIGQCIGGHFSLKSKKMEVWFGRKVESYQRLLELAAVFATDPNSQEKYLSFIGAHDAAAIVASPKVADLFINPRADGLSVNAQRLRTAATPEELQKLQLTKWYDAMRRVTDAMREDVAGIAR